jgi:hypothetical protein
MTDKRKKRGKREKSYEGMGLPCELIPFIVNIYE